MSLWFNGQHFPDQLIKPAKSKGTYDAESCNAETPPPPPLPQASRPPRFSALVAKNTWQDGIELNEDCFAGNEKDECDTDISDNDRDSGDSNDEA